MIEEELDLPCEVFVSFDSVHSKLIELCFINGDSWGICLCTLCATAIVKLVAETGLRKVRRISINSSKFHAIFVWQTRI